MSQFDRVLHAALTDVGVKRSHNQDCYGVTLARTDETYQQRGHLFLVADGMGAHAVGELASKLAVDTIRHAYSKQRNGAPAQSLRAAIEEANQTIHEKGSQNPEFHGMGTTATALVLRNDGAHVGHVGDSRCYRIRRQTIEQLSFDHSLQWELARRQNVSPDELTSVPSNIIVRSLGPEASVKVDVTGPYPVEPGDSYVICSDGLSGQVSDQEIWSVVTLLPAEMACQFLVDLANLRGGIDNVTVIIVKVEDGQDPSHASPKSAPWNSLAEKLQLVHWSIWTAVAGLVLCALGYGLQLANVQGEFYVRVVGFVVLALGLGVFIQRKMNPPDDVDDESDPAPLYRTQDCAVDEELLERFANIEQSLHELAVEESWEMDWDALARHRQAAETFRLENRSGESFTARCASIAILFKPFRDRRDKHEGFDPRWRADDTQPIGQPDPDQDPDD